MGKIYIGTTLPEISGDHKIISEKWEPSYVRLYSKEFLLTPRSNPKKGIIDAAKRRFGITTSEKLSQKALETGDSFITVKIVGNRPRTGAAREFSDEQIQRLNFEFTYYHIDS